MNTTSRVITISAPRFNTLEFDITGIAPYVMLRFSAKAMAIMAGKMSAGSQSKKGKAREPRDFDDDYRQAFHSMPDGRHGIPASSFRNAIISACRLVGFKMTLAKLSVFIEADGYDVIDGVPLVEIIGTPEPLRMAVRNATGVADIRVRAMWREWCAKLRVRYDQDQFSETDVANLIQRVGLQVGIGEGRPDSKSSAGMGWGLFTIANS